MRRKIVVRPEAYADLSDISRWYEDRVLGLGAGFLHQVDAAIDRISDSPASYSIYYRDIRRIRLGKFPYAIFFVSLKSTIAVLGVFHLHRNPRSLRKRLRDRE
jgi:plasmid stabilization system protein ParE